MKRLLAAPFSLAISLMGMFFLLAAPAFGQLAQDGELNPFFGVSAHTKNEFQIGSPQASPPIDAKFELADALRFGLRFNVFTNARWGQEFSYSYEHNRARYVQQVVPLSIVDLPIQIHNLGVTALFYLNNNETAKTRPFLSIGGGATVYKPTKEARIIAEDPSIGNMPGFGTSNEISFHYGVGFKRRLNRVVGFRMDVRHYIGRNPSFSMSRRSNDPSVRVFPADGAIHNVEASGGLVFYFGR
jgi:outer membrane protein W